MMTLEQVVKALQPMNLRAVCRAIGYTTKSQYIRVRLSLIGKRPAYYSDIKALSDYLEGLHNVN